jgi:hypothetical protein
MNEAGGTQEWEGIRLTIIKGNVHDVDRQRSSRRTQILIDTCNELTLHRHARGYVMRAFTDMASMVQRGTRGATRWMIHEYLDPTRLLS